MATQAVGYFTLTAILYQDETIPNALAILVTNVTEQGHYLQELTQNRNELRLLRQQLMQRNAQLDLLLHHYLPHTVAEALLKGDLRPDLGGDLREVSIYWTSAKTGDTVDKLSRHLGTLLLL